MPWMTSPCWKALSAKTWTAVPPVYLQSSIRWNWSSPTIRKDRWRNEAVNNPEDPSAHTWPSNSAANCGWNATTSWKTPRRNISVWHRGQEVRLKSGYIVKCTGLKDDNGNVVSPKVYCEYDPTPKNRHAGQQPQNQRHHPLGKLRRCLPAEVRLYDRLWKVENPRDEMAAIREAKNCDALEAMKEKWSTPDSVECINQCCREISGRCQNRWITYSSSASVILMTKTPRPEHWCSTALYLLKDTWVKLINKNSLWTMTCLLFWRPGI